MNVLRDEFQRVYETLQSRMLCYRSHLVGRDEAEDLTQEVFTKVNRTLDNSRGDSQFSTGIDRNATNSARD